MVALVPSRVAVFELGIVAEVFGLERPELDVPWWYSLTVCAERPGLVAAGAFGVQIDHGLEALRAADTLIVPGWSGEPSAALLAEQFATEVDFFSIGTNDLTQYTLAMDRGHPRLAPQVDGLNPAVLRLIAHTVKGAEPLRRPVGVCGGIASDRAAIPILIGIGVSELVGASHVSEYAANGDFGLCHTGRSSCRR